jgi:hypothetical protein
MAGMVDGMREQGLAGDRAILFGEIAAGAAAAPRRDQ